jgi:hypothetical protein
MVAARTPDGYASAVSDGTATLVCSDENAAVGMEAH